MYKYIGLNYKDENVILTEELGLWYYIDQINSNVGEKMNYQLQ